MHARTHKRNASVYLQQKRVDPFGERLLLDVQPLLLQGLDAALLELENVFPLSHSLLYLRTAPVSVGSRWWICGVVFKVADPSLGCGAWPSAGHILRPCNRKCVCFWKVLLARMC